MSKGGGSSKGSTQRNIAIVIIIILLLLFLARSASGTGGGTSTITTTQNGSTITSTTTFSSSTSFSSSSFSGVCNTFNGIYFATISGPTPLYHGMTSQYAVTMSSGSNIPNLPLNVQIIPAGGGSALFNQNFITGSQSYNFGQTPQFSVTIANPGFYQWIISWTQPQGNACQIQGLQVS